MEFKKDGSCTIQKPSLSCVISFFYCVLDIGTILIGILFFCFDLFYSNANRCTFSTVGSFNRRRALANCCYFTVFNGCYTSLGRCPYRLFRYNYWASSRVISCKLYCEGSSRRKLSRSI